jgi:NAD-dependent deacetylase
MESVPLTEEIRAKIREAARFIREARYLTAFTGAGISVESGIPPFRGPGGLWSKYDPKLLELSYFRHYPEKVWPVLKKLFFESFADAEPNEAHLVLAWLESAGYLKTLITQNIDSVL